MKKFLKVLELFGGENKMAEERTFTDEEAKRIIRDALTIDSERDLERRLKEDGVISLSTEREGTSLEGLYKAGGEAGISKEGITQAIKKGDKAKEEERERKSERRRKRFNVGIGVGLLGTVATAFTAISMSCIEFDKNKYALTPIQGTVINEEYLTDVDEQTTEKYVLRIQTENGEVKVFNIYTDEKALDDELEVGDLVKIDARGYYRNKRYLQNNDTFDVRYIREDLYEKSWERLDSPIILGTKVKNDDQWTGGEIELREVVYKIEKVD